MMGACLSMRIVTDRLIVSLAPRTSLKIEQEAQAWATLMQGEANGDTGHCFFLAQRLAMAQSVLETREEWERECKGLGHRSLIASSTGINSSKGIRASLTSSKWQSATLQGSTIKGRGVENAELTMHHNNRDILPCKERVTISKSVFERWCGLLGRRVDSSR